MRILPIAAVLALSGSITVAHAGAPKAYVGIYGPEPPNRACGWSAQAKVRPVQDAFAQVRCAKLPRHIGPIKCRLVLI
jgi:hypothetical protein